LIFQKKLYFQPHSPSVRFFIENLVPMKKILLLCYLLPCTILAQKKDNILEKILYLRYDKFKTYLEDPNYNIQIIYTQIDRNENNIPRIKTHKYKVDTRNYFYPASTVKLPAILLSLEKVNKINKEKEEIVINRNTRMSNLAGKFCGEGAFAGNPKDTNPPSIAKYAEQILLVSDNIAFSRLYEFLGQKYIHETLYQKGYDSIRIVRRLASSCNSPQQNKCTNPILFHNEQMQVVYKQEEICNDSLLSPIYPRILLGKAHIDATGKYQNFPLDCTYNNFLPLDRLHEMLIAALMPEALAPQKRFYLQEEDHQFLRRMMGAYPREGQKTTYLPQQGYFDAYKKYFLYGQDAQAKINPNIRIFNIVGLAYGFAIDSAYIVDFENDVEFFLTAVIHTNKNGIINDNTYEYASEAMPFLKLLSETILKYEQAKEKKYKPVLKN